MRKVIRRVSALIAAALMVALALPASPAGAHGEAAQEAWLRMGTVAFWDVEFSSNKIGVNEEMTITGTAKVLETWPEQLKDPKLGFISVVSAGSPLVIKKRLVNGIPTPHSILIEKGGIYNFEITLAGRIPSKYKGWHVHPIFGVHSAGSLIGPGEYIEVTGDQGDFKNMATLTGATKNGEKVDLERIGMGGVALFNIIWFAIGMAWMIYWTVPKPTVTRLPVSLAVPLNSDGGNAGLITKKDHRFCNMIMALTLVILIAGMVIQTSRNPDRIPLQVLRFKPPAIATDPSFSVADGVKASFDDASNTMTMVVNITNTGDADATIDAFYTNAFSFTDGEGLSADKMTIPAGGTEQVTLQLQNDRWRTERLVPDAETRPLVTGVVRLESGGQENFTTVQAFLER
ncbi:MAG: methane monooxygenase/ammonia monooxygenase subunit B [Nocardioides sp.]